MHRKAISDGRFFSIAIDIAQRTLFMCDLSWIRSWTRVEKKEDRIPLFSQRIIPNQVLDKSNAIFVRLHFMRLLISTKKRILLICMFTVCSGLFFLERSMWSTQQPNNSRKRMKHSFQSITQKHLPSLLLFVCIYVPHTQTLMIARIECHGFYQHTNTCEHGLMQPSIWWPADVFLYWIFYVHYINWSAFLHIAPQHSINDLQTIAKRASF